MALVSLLSVPPVGTTCTLNVLKFIPLVIYKKVKTNSAEQDQTKQSDYGITCLLPGMHFVNSSTDSQSFI